MKQKILICGATGFLGRNLSAVFLTNFVWQNKKLDKKKVA